MRTSTQFMEVGKGLLQNGGSLFAKELGMGDLPQTEAVLVVIAPLQCGAIQIVPAGNTATALAKEHLLSWVFQCNGVAAGSDQLLNQLWRGELQLLHGKGGLFAVHRHHNRQQCLFSHGVSDQGEVDCLLSILGKEDTGSALLQLMQCLVATAVALSL